MRRPVLAVADIVRQHGDALLAHDASPLAGAQHRALRALAVGRTAALGGHITPGDPCGHAVQASHACRHRCCPTCHGTAQAAWRAARERAVLDTPDVHGIFTLPHALEPLVLQNPRHLSGRLCRTVAQTLQDIAGDPTPLGAEMGGVAVLPTGGQPLYHHPHLPCVLPAGGLAPDGSAWGACRPPCCLPVRGLSRRCRRLDLAGLAHLYGQGHLTWRGRCRERAEPPPWRRLLAALRDQEGVVDATEPLLDPPHVLKSLARSTHRVAISHHRLVALQDGQGTFRSKDSAPGHRLRPMTRDAVECWRRLMRHVPPHGFHRMRHFGFLATRVRQEQLAQCRALLGPAPPPGLQARAADLTTAEAPWGEPGARWPVWQHGHRQRVQTWSRQPAVWDLAGPAPGLDTAERKEATQPELSPGQQAWTAWTGVVRPPPPARSLSSTKVTKHEAVP